MKPILFIINTILLALTAYLCILMIYKPSKTNFSDLEESPQEGGKISQNPRQVNSSFEDLYSKIKKRNLFKVRIEDEKNTGENHYLSTDQPDKLLPPDLDLILLGTVTGTNAYAVIEIGKTKLQNLYKIGDEIQETTLKKIFRDYVILSYDNQEYILEMDTRKMSEPSSVALPPPPPMTDKTILLDRSLVLSALKDIDDLKRQIKFRPLKDDDKSKGLLIYGINPDSFINSLGLENGDIIRQINGNPTLSYEDAVEIYQHIKDTSDVRVSILRNGKLQDIVYNIRTGKEE